MLLASSCILALLKIDNSRTAAHEPSLEILRPRLFEAIFLLFSFMNDLILVTWITSLGTKEYDYLQIATTAVTTDHYKSI